MQAEIIAVGSELLTPEKLDTNSLFLTHRLNDYGISVIRKCVIGDDRKQLEREIRHSRTHAELVILSGGLGPTLDDLTREAVADATGLQLVYHEAFVKLIQERFRKMNRPMADVNKRQGYILEGAEILDNPHGTAPGQWLEDDDGILILLPGPPRELKPLFENTCLPKLAPHAPSQSYYTMMLRVAGIGESDLEQIIAPIYSRESNIATTILSSPGDIQIHLRATAKKETEARRICTTLGEKIHTSLGDAVYSLNGDSLEQTVARLLLKHGWKLAIAESCTGGLLASKLTELPGSSEFFAGGFVSYCESAKSQWLGIDEKTLHEQGAVSLPVAAAMAAAAREQAAKTMGEPAVGVSTTGFAGPAGGTAHDPVGTVYFGIASQHGVQVHRQQFTGGRHRVRTMSVQTALDFLRRRIMDWTNSDPASSL